MKRTIAALSGSCFLVLSMLLIPINNSEADPVLLARNVSEFTVLNDTEVLYCDSDANFFIVSTQFPDSSRPWDPGWDPILRGWEEATTLVYLCASPDGQWVCFAQFVAIPDDMLQADEFVPWPLAVVVAPVYGTTAWLAALAWEVGGGPGFDFTMDSMNLYGQPFVSSETSLEDFLACFRRDPDRMRVRAFSKINLQSGERTGNNLCFNDGYVPCPYSDLVAADDMCIGIIADMSTEEVVFGDPVDTCFYFEVEKWVLEDAILVRKDGEQCLLYADGTVVENPGEDDIIVYCWMPGGEYVFSADAGRTVLYGSIDWESFSSSEAVAMSDSGVRLSIRDKILPMADGSGIVFYSYELEGLVFHPVPVIGD